MKNKISFVLVILFLFFSCEKDTSEEDLLAEEADSEIEYKEFFIATADGKDFVVENPDLMESEIRYGFQSGIPAIVISAYEQWANIFIYSCFYDGKGVYSTGNDKDVSYAWYDDYKTGEMLFNDPGMGDPGVVEITYADEHVIEGTFKITTYSYDIPGMTVEMEGKFGLLLEKDD